MSGGDIIAFLMNGALVHNPPATMTTTHIPYRILHARDSIRTLEEPATTTSQEAPSLNKAVPIAKAIRAALMAGVALILSPDKRPAA